MSGERILNRADALVERVRGIIVAEPGTRAALRRGVGLAPEDPLMVSAHRVVAPYTTGEHPNTERAFYAVATIMAAQSRDARDQQDTAPDGEARPETADGGPAASAHTVHGTERTTAAGERKRPNLGVTLAEAAFQNTLNADTTEQRLHLLARQQVSGVHRHLPRLVLHLRGERVPIDWGMLARDLARWGHSPRQVAKEWVQGYHRTLETLRRKAAAAENTTDNEGSAAA